MKVVLLGDAGSIHTIRWANGLVEKGHNIYLVSLHELKRELNQKVKFSKLHFSAPLGYLLSRKELRKILEEFQPDVVNVHYATGYGFLARIIKNYPYILSVWGSDIYDFPNKSMLHRYILKKNLQCADAIASTSKAMAKETRKIYPHPSINITPFGVDEELFKPSVKHKQGGKITVGTVKTLSYIYGVDILIKAFSMANEMLGKPDNFMLEISGKGQELAALKKLTKKLEIEDKVKFWGYIEYQNVPDMLRRLDIYVALSRSESFGVSILEAGSCSIPSIVSDADGPKEVVVHNKTGYIVPIHNLEAIAEYIVSLYKDKQLREKIGDSARKYILSRYKWEYSISIMERTYLDAIKLCNDD